MLQDERSAHYTLTCTSVYKVIDPKPKGIGSLQGHINCHSRIFQSIGQITICHKIGLTRGQYAQLQPRFWEGQFGRDKQGSLRQALAFWKKSMIVLALCFVGQSAYCSYSEKAAASTSLLHQILCRLTIVYWVIFAKFNNTNVYFNCISHAYTNS